MSKLRSIEVTFENGAVIRTNMAAHLTDEEMLSYYEVGTYFNIGRVGDNMQRVKSATILK